MYNPPTQPPYQPDPRRRLSPFWRNFLVAFVLTAVLGCLLGGIGLAFGLRTGRLALPNGMTISALQPAPDGYLMQRPDLVVFITFNAPPQEGDNSGSVYNAHVERSIYFHDQAPWTGTQSGSHLTMFFGDGTTWRADWTGTTLIVTYPDADGQFITALFAPASIADYNNATSALQQSTR